MRRIVLAVLLMLFLLSLIGCVPHTYYVELTNGRSLYVDPPLILDTEAGTYSMSINGVRQIVPMDDVSLIDDAAQICFKNKYTDTFTCFDALYQF